MGGRTPNRYLFGLGRPPVGAAGAKSEGEGERTTIFRMEDGRASRVSRGGDIGARFDIEAKSSLRRCQASLCANISLKERPSEHRRDYIMNHDIGDMAAHADTMEMAYLFQMPMARSMLVYSSGKRGRSCVCALWTTQSLIFHFLSHWDECCF